MRRILCSVLAVFCLLAVYAPAVGASSEWCEDDPPLTVPTSRPEIGWGQDVVVHVTNMAKGDHLADVVAARSFMFVDSVKPSRQKDSVDVEVRVVIPKLDPLADEFQTRSIVSEDVRTDVHGMTTPVGLLDTAQGRSGQIMRLKFRLTRPAA